MSTASATRADFAVPVRVPREQVLERALAPGLVRLGLVAPERGVRHDDRVRHVFRGSHYPVEVAISISSGLVVTST